MSSTKFGVIKVTKTDGRFSAQIGDSDFSNVEMLNILSHLIEQYWKECRQEYILHSGIEEPSKEDLLAWIEFQQSIGL